MNTRGKSEKKELLALIRQAQNGDESAFSRLFAQYWNLIDSACHQYAPQFPSEQEICSVAIEALWNAVCSYDTEQSSVTFGLYAQICIRNRIISLLRKNRHTNTPLSLDAAEELCADEDSNPAHYVIEQEKYRELEKIITDVLSVGEQQIWLRFVAGHTAAEIAQELGKEPKSVENAIYRARKKLRGAIPPR